LDENLEQIDFGNNSFIVNGDQMEMNINKIKARSFDFTLKSGDIQVPTILQKV
jgi:hypothetical protein